MQHNSIKTPSNLEGRGKTPLVFVFLGTEFPPYAIASIKIAKQTTPNPIVVLAEATKPAAVPADVDWVTINSFYSGQQFSSFDLAPPYSEDFRGGFWLKTAERFFVLHAFMTISGLSTIFHGELDCLFFNLPSLEREVLETELVGVFLPRETNSRCVASIVYINDPSVLDSLCKFILENSHLGNEMDILGALNHNPRSRFYALPTAEFLFRAKPALVSSQQWSVVPKKPTFIADGAVIGRWIFGVDPRNTGGRGTKNRLQNHKYGVPFIQPLASLIITQNPSGGWQIQITGPSGIPYNLAVIHVHSKIHDQITLKYINRLLKRLKQGKSTVIVPIEPAFPFQVARRITRQIFITFGSVTKIRALFSDAISPSWWQGLASRVTKL